MSFHRLDNHWAISYARPDFAHGIEIAICKWGERPPLTLWEKIKAKLGGTKEYIWANFAKFGELPKPLPIGSNDPNTEDDDYAVFHYLTREDEKILLDWIKNLPNRDPNQKVREK